MNLRYRYENHISVTELSLLISEAALFLRCGKFFLSLLPNGRPTTATSATKAPESTVLIMMKILGILLVTTLFLCSCKKLDKDHSTCYQGKFLNELGCYDLVAVQVTNPPLVFVDAKYRAADGKDYLDAIGLVIPAEFRDGEPFYFTLDSIFHRPALPGVCFYVPKYFGALKSISKTNCP